MMNHINEEFLSRTKTINNQSICHPPEALTLALTFEW
jgi:hypothetical protein